MPLPRLKPLLSLLILLTGAAAPAVAQRSGTLELVPLGRYSFYPDSLDLNNGFGIGAEVGLFLTSKLSFELGGSYGVTSLPDSASVAVRTQTGRLLVHLPLRGRTSALFGLGYSRHQYSRGLDTRQEGVSGLAGFRFGLGPRLGLRVEAVADFVAPPSGGAERQWDVGLQAGLSMFAGPLGPRDNDHDGVPNTEDRCPGTARNAPVDPTGCDLAKDTDGDGVLDGGDRCPGTPAGRRVDLTGCNADSDGDGVLNSVDRCPDTLAGVATDAFGCPPPLPPADSDHDGVPDDRDRCPGSPPKAAVDALGCPPPVSPAPPPPRLILHDVTFRTGSATLTAASEASLRATAASLLGQPTVRLEVSGYTDNTGTPVINDRLSQARAESVRAFLVSAGVPGDQLTARGYGSRDPVASNTTAEGRALNRRVELKRVE